MPSGAREPRFRLPQQPLEGFAARGRQVRIDLGAVARLKVAEVAVALRKTPEQLRVERDPRLRIDRIEAVLLVDHRALGDAPGALALLDPVEETAVAHRVDLDPVEPRAHVDRHARLRDRAIAFDVGCRAAQEMLRPRSLAP